MLPEGSSAMCATPCRVMPDGRSSSEGLRSSGPARTSVTSRSWRAVVVTCCWDAAVEPLHGCWPWVLHLRWRFLDIHGCASDEGSGACWPFVDCGFTTRSNVLGALEAAGGPTSATWMSVAFAGDVVAAPEAPASIAPAVLMFTPDDTRVSGTTSGLSKAESTGRMSRLLRVLLFGRAAWFELFLLRLLCHGATWKSRA